MRSTQFQSLAGIQHVITPNRLRIALHFASVAKAWNVSPNNADVNLGTGFTIAAGAQGTLLLAKDVGDIVRGDWYAQEAAAPATLNVVEIIAPPGA